MKILNQTGDTIVEVLIAISVLAFALGTGYATVNRSNQSILANKERYQAQLLANQQVELLRQYIDVTGSKDAISNSGFKCYREEGGSAVIKDSNFPPNNNSCDFSDSIYGATYKVVTKYIGTCSSSTFCSYNITVSWDSVKGGQERLSLWYGR
jgi:type II secretory pathway pseudopilin PulG